MIPNIDAVLVRTVSRGSASTIDTITDSTETLTINIEKEAVFYISDGEVTQCGPLNPGEFLGANIATKVAADLDGRILFETLNAEYDFDEGDLTTGASTGTAFRLTSTTVPQMVSRLPAKLVSINNQTLSNMAFIIDSYAAAGVAEYLLGKQFDVVESVFKNGYAGNISTAEVYISENLTSQVTFTQTGVLTGTGTKDRFTINGVTFLLVTATPAAAGEISIGGQTVALQLASMKIALENPGTTSGTTYYALSAANAAKVSGSTGISCAFTATTLTLYAIGGKRLVVTETVSGGAFSSPYLHCYYGKKGAIDVVVQDLAPVEMRKTSTMRGTNVFSSYLAGIKTYADGAKKFLDVMVDIS